MAKRISKNATYDINALSEAFDAKYDETERTLDNFKLFLKANKLSTIHAEEIYQLYNGESNSLSLKENSFKIRKTHPKRDTFIKKVVIPTALTSAAIGAGIGLIAASGLIGGSTILGLIPVSATPGVTATAVSIVGAATGLALTPSIIAIKGAITKAHYKTWYKTAKRNLKDYKSGVDIEALPIKTLMDRIEKTNHKILNTKKGLWLTAPFRSFRRHILNKINRNRIHHVEAYTKDLVKMFHTLDHNNFQGKEEAIRPIYELLKQVDSFVSKNVRESKLHTLLTCKDSSKHTHKSMIENVDIFANLKTYIDAMAKAQLRDVKATKAQFKKNVKNIANKKFKANEIIEEERLIAKLVARYEAENALEVGSSVEENPIVEDVIFEEPIIATFEEIIEEPIEEADEEIIEEIPEESIEEVTEEAVEDITEEVTEVEEVVEEIIEEPGKEEIVEELPKIEVIQPIGFCKIDFISHWFTQTQKYGSKYINSLLLALEETVSRDKSFYAIRINGNTNESQNFYADVLANDPEFKKQPWEVVEYYRKMETKVNDIYQLINNIKKNEEIEARAKQEVEKLENENARLKAELDRLTEQQVNSTDIKNDSTQEEIVEEIATEETVEEIVQEQPVKEETTVNTPKVNLVVKTAQRLSYETRPITTNGDIVGTTLKIKSNGETEKVEIRYMKRNKQIRIKTTRPDATVSQTYHPLTDTTVPPITQMNTILRKVAEDKHISNVEDLIIEA